MKFYFILLAACAGYFAFVRQVGFESANGVILFLLWFLAPVWIGFGYIYWEMKLGTRPTGVRDRK